jgi:hypothetical protein
MGTSPITNKVESSKASKMAKITIALEKNLNLILEFFASLNKIKKINTMKKQNQRLRK